MSKVCIYHNPRCSKSRQALALLEQQGDELEIVEYIETPPDSATLSALLQQLGMNARDLMRRGEDIYKELQRSAMARPSRCMTSRREVMVSMH